MIHLRDNEPISGQFNTEDGTTYPSNWLDYATDEDKEKIGVISLQEIFPVLSDNQRYNGYIDDVNARTRTYTVIDIPSET